MLSATAFAPPFPPAASMIALARSTSEGVGAKPRKAGWI